MRKSYISIFKVMLPLVLLFCGVASAMAITEVHVEEAGTLSTLVSTSESTLKITGPLNGTDIKHLRSLINAGTVTDLDISEASIVSGGEAYDDESHTTEDGLISKSMFYNCSRLKSIVLPTNITEIKTGAFANTKLSKIEIPDGVVSIGTDAFAYISTLETVIIGKQVAGYGQGVFYNSSVKKVYVKSTVSSDTPAYFFSSNPTIYVYTNALESYKDSKWADYGTIVGGLEKFYPQGTDYTTIVNERRDTYFEDAACTKLKAEYLAMSDEALTTAFTEGGMPKFMVDIALKLKNDTWAAYEKDFRIHSYNAYSDAEYWNERLQCVGGSYMGNPTGIYAAGGDQLFVFVDSDIPEDATLYIQGCIGNSLITSAKTGKCLRKGLNILDGTKDALYYIVYTADTRSMEKTLDKWPDIKIHIQGGRVNGYYDVARHSDQAYVELLNAAELELFTIKGTNSLINFQTSSYKEFWPTSIDSSIEFFDNATVWMQSLIGIRAEVANGERNCAPYYLSGGEAIAPLYYNNPNFAVQNGTNDPAYANATWYRTMYSLDAVRYSFCVPQSSWDGGWVIGHECGHQLQSPIFLEGTTEGSNDLFSNLCSFLGGRKATRGETLAEFMLEYAERVPFANHSGKGRMYYNLYLYFHQAQKNTSFFPELFKALREDPLKTYNPDCDSGNQSVLKFVRKACEIAEEDLSDYFRVWGFLDPLSEEEVEGGQLTVTKTNIDNTLNELAKYPKNRTLLFIEDRVKPLYTTAPFNNTTGELRDGYSNMAQYGNLGQFTDYLPGACESANYTYMKYGSLYQMTGSGGVGFLMLDEDNNFVYASNSLNFYIPSSITTEFTIYSVDADGTLSEVPQADGGTNETLFYIRNVRDSEYYVTTTKGLNGGAQQLGSAKSFTDDKTKVLFKLLENGKIVSVNTSSELYLRYKDSNAGEGGSCVELSKTDDQNIWTLEARTNGGHTGFAIIAGTSGNSLNMHGNAGNDMGLFRKTDAGSVWEFVSVTKTEYLNGLISVAEALHTTANANTGDKIGEYSPTAVEALSTAIAIVKAIEGDVTTEHVVALKNAMDAVKVILPTAGKYYQIHSSLAAFSETKAVYSDEEDRARWKSLNNDDKSFYWKAVATPDDAIVLQNAQDGKYMEGRYYEGEGWKMADSYSDASKLSIKIHNKENKNGYEYGLIMNNWQMHAKDHDNGNGSEGKIVSYNDGANSASAWYIREVELPKEFCAVTYSFVYNVNDVEKVYSTTTSEVSKGATYPAVVVPALPYGVSVNATTPEGNVTEDIECEFTLEVTKNLPFVAAADVNSIETWYYARMHSNKPGYLGDIADDKSINVAEGKSSDVYNENFLWGFVGNVWDGITVVNKSEGNLQLTSTGSGNVTLTENGTSFFVAHTTETTANATNGFCLRKKDSNQYINANHDHDGQKLSHWNETDAGSTMFLTKYVEKEISVSDVNWATMYLDYAAYIPEGVNAYSVTGVESGYVTLTKLEGVIPANTGVILENKGNYTFKMAAKDNASAEGNLLSGSVENTYVEGAAYVLANGNKGVGLYKAALNKDAAGAEGTTHFLNNAGKAYLPASAVTSNAAMFSFNRSATSIDNSQLTIDNAELVIYDLTGRRVEKMEKGIYIVNGKKVLVK